MSAEEEFVPCDECLLQSMYWNWTENALCHGCKTNKATIARLKLYKGLYELTSRQLDELTSECRTLLHDCEAHA